MVVAELARVRELEREDGKLKRICVGQALDGKPTKELVAKKSGIAEASRGG